MDPQRGSQGRGEKRAASGEIDASSLFKRGGAKATRVAVSASAANNSSHGTNVSSDADARTKPTNVAVDVHGVHAHASNNKNTSHERTGKVVPFDTTEASILSTSEIDPTGGSMKSHSAVLTKFRTLLNAMQVPLSLNPENSTACVWDAHSNVAEVVRQRGKHLTKMGHAVGNQLFLLPEEVLYLVETERAFLLETRIAETGTHKNPNQIKPMSLRAVHSLINNSRTLPTDAYTVFAFLQRRGYVVRRFGARWSLAAKNNSGRIDHSSATGQGAWSSEISQSDAVMHAVRVNVDNLPADDGSAPMTEEATDGNLKWYPRATRWLGQNKNEVWNNATLTPQTSNSRTDTNTSAASPVFTVYSPTGQFSKKNPGPVDFYVFVRCVGFSEKDSGINLFAPTRPERDASLKKLRLFAHTNATEDPNMNRKIVWATVVDGVVVLHKFKDI